MSHPTWVRGLKPHGGCEVRLRAEVAPHVGAWIETIMIVDVWYKNWSHPTWVRGLKLSPLLMLVKLLGRTPRGCVD